MALGAIGIIESIGIILVAQRRQARRDQAIHGLSVSVHDTRQLRLQTADQIVHPARCGSAAIVAVLRSNNVGRSALVPDRLCLAFEHRLVGVAEEAADQRIDGNCHSDIRIDHADARHQAQRRGRYRYRIARFNGHDQPHTRRNRTQALRCRAQGTCCVTGLVDQFQAFHRCIEVYTLRTKVGRRLQDAHRITLLDRFGQVHRCGDRTEAGSDVAHWADHRGQLRRQVSAAGCDDLVHHRYPGQCGGEGVALLQSLDQGEGALDGAEAGL